MNLVLPYIILPLIAALICAFIREENKIARNIVTFTASSVVLVFSFLNIEKFFLYATELLGDFNMYMMFRIDNFSSYLIFAIAGFVFLTLIYAMSYLKDKPLSKWFHFNLMITLSFACGVLMADSFILLLLFWEGLLLSLYGFLVLSNNTQEAKQTALKAFIINGFGDILLLGGFAILGLKGLSTLSEFSIVKIDAVGWNAWAFIMIGLGALAKAGIFFFHGWIPDAAKTSSSTFMAIMPGSIEKILSIYFFTKIVMGLFNFCATPLKFVFAALGIITVLYAIITSLWQTDLRKFLAYQVIAQIGFFAIAPVFKHLHSAIEAAQYSANHAIYKACILAGLFLAVGAIEYKTKTTDISKLSGLLKKMPITVISFIALSLGLMGITASDLFFTHHGLIYKMLKGQNHFWLVLVLLANLLIIPAFLRVIWPTFLKGFKKAGKLDEAPIPMILPIMVLTFVGVLFASGWEYNLTGHLLLPHIGFDKISIINLSIIISGFFLYLVGAERFLKLPILKQIVDLGKSKTADCYELGMNGIRVFANFLFKVDRLSDYLIDTLPVKITKASSSYTSNLHKGYSSAYIVWAVIGLVIFILLVKTGFGL